MRELLIHDYLCLARIPEALAQRFPDDMAGKLTALRRPMGQQETASREAINIAGERYPEVRKMSLADKPKQANLQEDRGQVDGKDEAWYYRQDHLDLWQPSGGLKWLRQKFGKAIKS